MKKSIVFCGVLAATYLCVGSANAAVLYENTFSSTPSFLTDNTDAYRWDAGTETFAMHLAQGPQTTVNRFVGFNAAFDPARSFILSWRQNILAASSSSQVPFGLLPEGLVGATTTPNAQGGFSQTSLGYFNGNPSYHAVDVFTSDGRNESGSGTGGFGFGQNKWYTLTQTYDADLRRLSFAVKDEATGSTIFQTSRSGGTNGILFGPQMHYIGSSMHAVAKNGTPAAQAPQGSYVDVLIDDIRLEQDVPEVPKPSVLFLPGFQASRLYTEGVLGTEDTLWEPNNNEDALELSMNPDGTSIHDIYTRDIIDNVLTFDVYKTFIQNLDALVATGTISKWQPFAYDWRVSVDDIVEYGTKYHDGVKYPTVVLEEMAARSGGKVTIIAHSNGGLLAKALIERLRREGKDGLVDKIIFIATPHLGTPKAVGSLLHGYDQELVEGYLVTSETMRTTSRNIAAAYGLVPSGAYFAEADTPMITFSTSTLASPYTASYGTSITTLDELIGFMTGEGDGRVETSDIRDPLRANGTLLRNELTLHETVLDPWVAPPHIEVYEFLGTGLDTVRGFTYQELVRRECALGFINCIEKKYLEALPLLTEAGDATVVLPSAQGYEGTKEQLFVDLKLAKEERGNSAIIKHANITELSELHRAVSDILVGTGTPYRYISNTAPVYATERELISVHSPVSLALTDGLGNFVGSTTAGVVEDIPGSSYFELGESKYIVVPKGTNYTVNLKGEGEEGSYTLMFDAVVGDGTPQNIRTFTLATVTPSMNATLTKEGTTYSPLRSDYNNDGTIDETKPFYEEPVVTKALLYGQLRIQIQNLTKLPLREKNSLLKVVDKAAVVGSCVTKTCRVAERVLLEGVRITVHAYTKKNLITTQEFGILVTTIDAIIKKI